MKDYFEDYNKYFGYLLSHYPSRLKGCFIDYKPLNRNIMLIHGYIDEKHFISFLAGKPSRGGLGNDIEQISGIEFTVNDPVIEKYYGKGAIDVLNFDASSNRNFDDLKKGKPAAIVWMMMELVALENEATTIIGDAMKFNDPLKQAMTANLGIEITGIKKYGFQNIYKNLSPEQQIQLLPNYLNFKDFLTFNILSETAEDEQSCDIKTPVDEYGSESLKAFPNFVKTIINNAVNSQFSDEKQVEEETVAKTETTPEH